MYTFTENFRRTSPYADMVPGASEFAAHPFRSTGILLQAVKLTELARGARADEKRQRRVDDVSKRTMYRKAHGLETQGYGGLTNKPDEEGVGPAIPVRNPGLDAADLTNLK